METNNKLREALEKVATSAEYALGQDDLDRGDLLGFVKEMGQDARAALAEPVKNCEVGTAEEQAERFILFCLRNSFRGVCNDSCKFANVNRRLGWQEIGQARCFPFWAQMHYKEGGTK